MRCDNGRRRETPEPQHIWQQAETLCAADKGGASHPPRTKGKGTQGEYGANGTVDITIREDEGGNPECATAKCTAREATR